MREILTAAKYDGYKIKCRTCRCDFFAPFNDMCTDYDDRKYVSCPYCSKKIYRSLFWKKYSRYGDMK